MNNYKSKPYNAYIFVLRHFELILMYSNYQSKVSNVTNMYFNFEENVQVLNLENIL